MNRSTAREIAVHLTFALAFSSESAEDLLARELTPERFALRAKDEPLYAEFPGEGELAYVTRLARGVGQIVSCGYLLYTPRHCKTSAQT